MCIARNMADDLVTLKQIKCDTKKFLEEASTIIQLVNLVDNYRQRKTELNKCSDCEVNDHNETSYRKSRSPQRHAGADGGPRPRRTVRRKTTQPHKLHLSESYSSPKTIELKKISRCQLEVLKLKMDREIKPKRKKEIRHKRDKHHSQNRSNRITHKNASARIVKKEIRRILSSNLDMDNVQKEYLRNLSGLTKRSKSRKPIASLEKANNSKRSSRTTRHLTDTKRNPKKHKHTRKTVNKNPSLHLMLNLTLKPNSNTIKMQIDSKTKTSISCKSSAPNVMSIRFPSKSGSCGHQERINKKIKNHHSKISTNSTMRDLRSFSQSSNDQMMKQSGTLHPYVRLPYHKTQAVYNVYDMVQYQRPGQVRGIKSRISFKFNIGNPPPAQNTAYTDETSSINTQYGTHVGKPCHARYKNKVNYQNGSTSLQQCLSVGRGYPKSENYSSDYSTQQCDCEPIECAPDVSEDQQTCVTCCQALPEPRSAHVDVLENFLTLFKRTKRRIVERVTNVSREASSIVLNPRAFMSRIHDNYRAINNRVEQRLKKDEGNNNRIEKRLKDRGSCTCSPLLDTDQVQVYEENVEPECSFLERCFGTLFYNNKCIVCSQQKAVKPGTLKCTPGECVPAGLLFRLRKKFEEYKRKCKQQKCEKQNKKLKAKLKKVKKVAKKNLKNAKKKSRGGKKGSPVCRFLLSIFKKPDDKRKLLKKGNKGRKHKGDGDKGKGAGSAPGIQTHAKKGLNVGRRHFRRATRRIRERYYRNKKLAEEQKGRYACDFYLMSLRNKPCLWVYYMCPFWYPYCLQLLNFWRQLSDVLLFFVAIIVWSPCILAAECLKVMACNMCV